MKILYFANLFPSPSNTTCGIFNYHRARILRDRGIYLSVARAHNVIEKRNGFSFGKNYELKRLGYESDITVYVYNGLCYPRWGLCWSVADKLAGEFRTGGYDIIHAHFVCDAYPVYIANQKYGIPYVVTAHGSDIHTHPFQDRQMKEIVLRTLNNAERSIFVSQALLHKARELGYKGDSVVVIPNGYDPDIFRPRPTDNHAQGSGKNVGYIGSLSHVKGADRIPDIFHKIYASRKIDTDMHFTIIGEGPLRKIVESKLHEIGLGNHVTFYDHLQPYDLASKLNRMDALIIPSRNEGWPCVIMESLACGIPIIASQTGGIPEAIGPGGALVPEGFDFEDRFALAVMDVLESPPSTKAMQVWASQFTWEKTMEREMLVYRDVIESIACH